MDSPFFSDNPWIFPSGRNNRRPQSYRPASKPDPFFSDPWSFPYQQAPEAPAPTARPKVNEEVAARESPHAQRRPEPNRPTTVTSAPASKAKVVSIPVRFVDSNETAPRKTKVAKPAETAASKMSLAAMVDAAIKIQSAYRGFLSRKQVRFVSKIAAEVDEIGQRIAAEQEKLQREPKERLRVNEMLMKLLFRLDSVHGARDFRKKVIRRVIMLQELIDSFSAQTLESPAGLFDSIHNEIVEAATAQSLETSTMMVDSISDETLEAESETMVNLPQDSVTNVVLNRTDKMLEENEEEAKRAPVATVDSVSNEMLEATAESTGELPQKSILEASIVEADKTPEGVKEEAKEFQEVARKNNVDAVVEEAKDQASDMVEEAEMQGSPNVAVEAQAQEVSAAPDVSDEVFDTVDYASVLKDGEDKSGDKEFVVITMEKDSNSYPAEVGPEAGHLEAEITLKKLDLVEDYNEKTPPEDEVKTEKLVAASDTTMLDVEEDQEASLPEDLEIRARETIAAEMEEEADKGHSAAFEMKPMVETGEVPNNHSQYVLKKVVEENEKLQQLVAALCMQNTHQCQMMARLIQRVDRLEKVVRKMEEKKKKRHADNAFTSW